MRHRWIALVVAAAAATAVPGPASAVSAASATPLVLASSAPPRHGGLQRRPAQIVYSGDGAAYFAGATRGRHRLRWTQYTPTSGRAAGADWHNDCQPDCVDGHFHAYRAALHVYRPRRLGGFRVFTRMAVRYSSMLPPLPASRRTMTFRLRYDTRARTYFWID